MMDLIYCAGGNKELAKIAIEEGFMYGSRSDDIRDIHCNGLIDINWVKYNWEDHKRKVKFHQPKYAVVPDVEGYDQLSTVLRQAEELETFCKRVIIVPKVHGLIPMIPEKYNIGLSIPTRYSGFMLDQEELVGRHIHLLGGTPNQQRSAWLKFRDKQTVIESLDCNSHILVSNFGAYWDGDKWRKDKNGSYVGKYETFRRSCKGIKIMWDRLYTEDNNGSGYYN